MEIRYCDLHEREPKIRFRKIGGGGWNNNAVVLNKVYHIQKRFFFKLELIAKILTDILGFSVFNFIAVLKQITFRKLLNSVISV